MTQYPAWGSWLAVMLAATGCNQRLRSPDLGGLYDRAAQHHDAMRNPVVVIPGILGSRLIDGSTGQIVWGAFGGGAVDPRSPDGAHLVGVPMLGGATLEQLRDSVEPSGVLDRATLDLLFLPVELNAYARILATLGVGGYRDELLGEAGAIDYGEAHYTCFQFAYDWRRDNVENAKRLHEFLVEKGAYVRQQRKARFAAGDAEVKFDIIAHSMGGLLTRYYLRYGDADLSESVDGGVTWAGARLVERAILIGTPSGGSAKALEQLVNGARVSPILPAYEPALLGTMPAVYQLLPRGRHGAVVAEADHSETISDMYDPLLWEQLEWGLANPQQRHVLEWLLPDISDGQERRRVALDHQRKCLERARRFATALDVPAATPAGLELYLFAGDAVPTASRVAVNRSTGAIRTVGYSPGDRTVTRSSALMDERMGSDWSPQLRSPIDWTDVTFLFSDHLGLTKDPAFSDNVLYLLLEEPRAALRP